MNIEMTSREIATLRLALGCWIRRCILEAATQDRLAIEFERSNPDWSRKAVANAKASREFQAEAEALLAKF